MSRAFNKVRYWTGTAIMALSILMFPYFYFQFQDRKLLGEEKEIQMKDIHLQRLDNKTLDLEEKVKMVTENIANLKKIDLKTGDRYSLYEARRQCFRELEKLPALEMNMYGPVLGEINITPELLIDPETPATSILIWKGSFAIKGVKYQIILEEESGKILFIQPEGESDDVLEAQWRKYLKISGE